VAANSTAHRHTNRVYSLSRVPDFTAVARCPSTWQPDIDHRASTAPPQLCPTGSSRYTATRRTRRPRKPTACFFWDRLSFLELSVELSTFFLRPSRWIALLLQPLVHPQRLRYSKESTHQRDTLLRQVQAESNRCVGTHHTTTRSSGPVLTAAIRRL
jgi:hypothetical protein